MYRLVNRVEFLGSIADKIQGNIDLFNHMHNWHFQDLNDCVIVIDINCLYLHHNVSSLSLLLL